MNRAVAAILALSILGGVASVGAVVLDEGETVTSAPANDVQRGPVQIAGSGIVEGSTGTIAIGTPVAGIVAEMAARWGERVTRGTLLFRIDDRDIADTRATAVAELAKAEAMLPPATNKLDAAKQLRGNHVVSEQDVIQRQADYAVAKSSIEAARAQIERIDTEIARRTVLAPITGRVLKINVRPGEFADTASAAPPVILMGDDDQLNVRVDVDEHDAWKVKPGMPATAYVPGNHTLSARLQFVRIEPYVLPKMSLTGSPTERTDTRVLQVIYSFDPATLPVYIGQQVDVVIGGPIPLATRERP